MNLHSGQPLPCIPAIAEYCQSDYLPAAGSRHAAQGIRPVPLAIPLPFSVGRNVAILLQKGRFAMDSTIKNWAVSGQEGTKPPTNKINWQGQAAA